MMLGQVDTVSALWLPFTSSGGAEPTGERVDLTGRPTGTEADVEEIADGRAEFSATTAEFTA